MQGYGRQPLKKIKIKTTHFKKNKKKQNKYTSELPTDLEPIWSRLGNDMLLKLERG